MKKVRRFADGGETEDMVAPGNEEAIKNRLMAGMPEEPDRVFAAPDRFSPKPQDFKSAFAGARSAGDKTFEFNGKKYTTDLAKPTAPVSTKSVASGERLGPTLEKAQALKASGSKSVLEKYDAKGNRRPTAEEDALEGVYPEQALMGGAGFGIKNIAKAAQNLANRGGAKEAATRVEPYLAKEAQMALPAPAKQLALPAPARQLGYDKAAGKTASKTAERNARTQGRQDEMSRENLRRYGMTDDTSRDAVNAVRENLGMGRGFKVMKKGGSTQSYASGGKVRSASSRADGIAIRGKTRA
jgi:hypothetical protein